MCGENCRLLIKIMKTYFEGDLFSITISNLILKLCITEREDTNFISFSNNCIISQTEKFEVKWEHLKHLFSQTKRY